jgi:serine/threonine protein kinase
LVIGDLGHAKDSGANSNSIKSSQAFGTNNYLAPEAHELRRSNKIDIWSFGCIVYELFNLEKLFNNRSPDKLRSSIHSFQVDIHLKIDKIKPVYVRVVRKWLLLLVVFLQLTDFYRKMRCFKKNLKGDAGSIFTKTLKNLDNVRCKPSSFTLPFTLFEGF